MIKPHISHSLSYSPDLAPDDFHFFLQLKRDIKDIHFTMDAELKDEGRLKIKEKLLAFFIDKMKKLIYHWKRYITVNGDY